MVVSVQTRPSSRLGGKASIPGRRRKESLHLFSEKGNIPHVNRGAFPKKDRLTEQRTIAMVAKSNPL